MGRVRRSAGASALALCGAVVAVPTAASAAGDLFHPYVSHDPGSWGANVATGDLTGDGRPDALLTTTYESPDDPGTWSMWVYPQQADGTLGAPTQVRTEGGYYSRMVVATADLDEDGDLDVAVTTTNGVELYEQDAGTLRHTWTAAGPEAHDLELADVSGDGLADLIVNTKDGVEVWWQINGDFMWAPSGRVLTASHWDTEVEVGDVNGDGLADVVTASGSTIEVFAQNADRSFAAPTSYESGGLDGWTRINGLALGDIDGDERADVHVSVGGNSPSSWVITRFQQADGTLGGPELRQSHDIPEALEVADVTGDGRGDLVVAHGGWSRVGVYDSTPGTNPAEQLYTAPIANSVGVEALTVGDVTGDGRPDVLVADSLAGLVLLRGAAPAADITAPDTRITSAPPSTHQSRTATFEFTATEVSTFTCRLDGAVWSECKSPMTYSGLAQGAHSFEVRATDVAGNTDPYPAWTSFSVEGPNTQVTSGPTGTIRATSAMFEFVSSQAVAYYECSLDKAAWQRCASPATVDGLATDASHTFEVRAVNSEGLHDSTPAGRTFTVEAAADLGVQLAVAPDPVKRGGVLTYTLQVTNDGPDPAKDLLLEQELTTGQSFLDASDPSSTSSTSCETNGSATVIWCRRPELAPGATWTVTVRTSVTVSKGSVGSAVAVRTPTWDPQEGDEIASGYVKVGGGKGR